MNEPYVLSVVIPLYLAGALLFIQILFYHEMYSHAKKSTFENKVKKGNKMKIGSDITFLFSAYVIKMEYFLFYERIERRIFGIIFCH